MPIHDWSHTKSGIFHHFHLAWIEKVALRLNQGILPSDYYALAEQYAGGFGPDVLTLQGGLGFGDETAENPDPNWSDTGHGGGLMLAAPPARFTAETEREFYHRKQRSITIRHASDDRVVAVIEIVSPGNKWSQSAFRTFVEKVGTLVERGIHLLILDLFPPTPRDPRGLHAAIWDEVAGQAFDPPEGKPLTMVAYESDLAIRAYIEPVAVGDALPDMPLFLIPGGYVPVPLEATYQSAWEAVPRRWRRVIEGA